LDRIKSRLLYVTINEWICSLFHPLSVLPLKESDRGKDERETTFHTSKENSKDPFAKTTFFNQNLQNAQRNFQTKVEERKK